MERTIRKINEWKGWAKPRAIDVVHMESVLNAKIALCNLNVLSKAGRLDEIPREVSVDVEKRIFSKLESPKLFKSKTLSMDQVENVSVIWSDFNKFLAECTCLNESERVDVDETTAARKMRKRMEKGEGFFRPRTLTRGLGLRNSGYCLHVSCMPNKHAPDSYIVQILVGASFNQDGFYTTTSCLSANTITGFECSCTHGFGTTGQCAHKAVHLSVLQDMKERPDDLLFLLKKKKSAKLETRMRGTPLKDAMGLYKKLRSIIPLDKCPLSENHRVYCLCRKPVRVVPREEIWCVQCEEWYHPPCINMSKEEFQRLTFSDTEVMSCLDGVFFFVFSFLFFFFLCFLSFPPCLYYLVLNCCA